MKPASNQLLNISYKLEILLDIGSSNDSFYYLDGNNLGAEVGDIVSVKLRGRLLNGLVISKKKFSKINKDESNITRGKSIKYLFVESILQKKIFDDSWREWIQSLASFYMVSNLKMFKTAFPPGWIGKYKNIPQGLRDQIWIETKKEFDINKNRLTKKEFFLMNTLLEKGNWQNELIKSGFNYTLINSMVGKNYLVKSKRKKNINTKLNSFPNDHIATKKPNPTNEQKIAFKEFQTMKPGDALLLWGETGSGKTEVYMRITEEQFLKKKSCLILAPEIGLIPQLIDRFSRRFNNVVYEYHSNCSASHRTLVWKKIINANEPLIVIGTRSAVFLPIKNLGLIIMDEEHDVSYKQDNPMPCYDAREIAVEIVKRNSAKLIFGSATPSMNTWKKCIFENNFKLVRMTQRISKNEAPEIRIIDMRDEFKKGNMKIFSSELLGLLSQIRLKNEQAIILIPRRGHSGFLSCRNCGYLVNCPNCDVPLSVHLGSKGKKWLSCHWCDHKSRMINHCPDCNSNAFKPFGIGTQRVIEFLNEEFPYLKVLRFDRDTTSGKDGHRDILSKFSKGDADILVGTQMLAKGIDIPNVTLSVVIAADGLLHRPDISAEEKSLQLFLQLAGRSGRAQKKGKVIFQTYKPNHPVIAYLQKRDYERFLIENSRLRKDADLFPFCEICLLKLSGENYELTESIAIKLAKYLLNFCEKKNWKLIGPAPGLVAKVGKKFRWQILIHGPEGTKIPLPDRSVLWKLIPKNVFLTIDVNPVEL
ncbi:Helicase PriA essential for oriC/DnaA-independent DNA replication [Prochlorococcus marinus str. MIT 9321]|uniref:Replication restart protein PriA n=1 Tax=Prochlorococcus marinus str. MIT 9401 TaxID=167551 RepID=A0A0A2B0W2_PROMR|nr:primosomal protein N' [Prochlorococcus marinus]KGG03656.1 Helicase PriA essential for oriC/DnaA-independent DNA replication [Prochlorococcus marinus str. MIT 9321]KGG04795.1 Helicase PriA essential for oriC/DnaA-independent DNA replication [Prochlorococcus marinus str. MIT 9322]KGG07481.1 Helicase PriA essential for oriC/DnaA-independent DNA replication [Prochlorococcus marinus str. MIT 9401]